MSFNTTKPNVENQETPIAFTFVIDSILIGCLSLVGFTGNTIVFFSLVLYRRLKRGDECISGLGFILQSIAVSNVVLLWSFFMMYVLPGLGFVTSTLRNCTMACHIIAMIMRPVYLAARTSVAWLTVAAGMYSTMRSKARTLVIGQPPSQSPKATVAMWIVVMVMLSCVAWTVPMSVDSWVILSTMARDNYKEQYTQLEGNFWYRLIYVDVISAASIIFPLAVALGTILIRMWRRKLVNIREDEVGKPVTVLVCFLLACYLPEAVLSTAVVSEGSQDRGVVDAPGSLDGEWLFYLSAASRFGIAVNSALAVLILALVNPQLKSCLCGFPVRKQKRGKGFKIYRCDDTTKMTFISEEEEASFSSRYKDADKATKIKYGFTTRQSVEEEEETSITIGRTSDDGTHLSIEEDSCNV